MDALVQQLLHEQGRAHRKLIAVAHGETEKAESRHQNKNRWFPSNKIALFIDNFIVNNINLILNIPSVLDAVVPQLP
jgi:hypothetical protein